jgi:hypothetical protein
MLLTLMSSVTDPHFMEQVNQKLIHTIESLADLGEAVAGSGDFDEMIRTSLHLLAGTLAIRRGAVLELELGGNALECSAIKGVDEQFNWPKSLAQPDAEILLVNPEGILLDDNDHQDLFLQHRDDLIAQGIEVAVPMIVRGELTGLVLLGGKATGSEFSDDDLGIIRSMVRHIGVGIHTHRLLGQLEQKVQENRRIYEDLRASYRDTVRAFAAAIDIKDKYTQGHSERVGKYSEIIARQLGWNEEEVEGIAIAGYLHDVGKLVVERDIINAPYRIDAKQSSELNRHPAAGYEILAPIHHPYADIPLMARHHHERPDGRGYPDGLVGDQICLGARIVSLADSFDAMTTDRPYRTRRSFPDVIDDLRCNTGKQFDGTVVVAFCRALLEEVQGRTKDRRIIKMLGKQYLESDEVVPLLEQLISDLTSPTLGHTTAAAS